MRQLYKHGDSYYIIHRIIPIHNFIQKDGEVNMELLKGWRDYIPKVDHVMRNETHFLFGETISDVEEVEVLM
jgi:hypothetical protein